MAPPSSAHVLKAEALALVSAALRHLRDAETLLTATPPSPDGAFYLAGYAPELIRKATLSENTLHQAIGHLSQAPWSRETPSAAEAALTLAIALDPIAHRYAHRSLAALHGLRWSTNARYKKTGTHKGPSARALLAEARTLTDEIVVDMWADGRFPGMEFP